MFDKGLPRFAHTCVSCTFLGRKGRFDIYHCSKKPSILARYANLAPEYISMPVSTLLTVEGDLDADVDMLKAAAIFYEEIKE